MGLWITFPFYISGIVIMSGVLNIKYLKDPLSSNKK